MSRSDVGNYYGHRSKVVLNQLCHITALLSLMAASDAKRWRILHLSRSQVSSMSQGVYKDGLDPESVISGNCEILWHLRDSPEIRPSNHIWCDHPEVPPMFG